MKLKDWLPREFFVEYMDTPTAKFLDEEVVMDFRSFSLKGELHHEFKAWVGSHQNVYNWVVLKNGYAVGMNENPSRGMSFPIKRLTNQEMEWYVHNKPWDGKAEGLKKVPKGVNYV